MHAFDATAFDMAAYDTPALILSLPVRVDVSARETAALAVRVSVASGPVLTDGGTSAAVWGMIVFVGGIDETANVIGEVTVEAEENAARVADLALYRESGTVITPGDWIGAPVEIWLGNGWGGAVSDAVPIFTGAVEVPTLTPGSGLLRLRCSDARKMMIDAMDAAALDALCNGALWSPVVFDKGAPMATRAADLLSTLEASLDVVPGGGLRLTGWREALPEVLADDDRVLDGSVAVDFAERSGMTNRVTVNFSHRFPRNKAEGYLIGFDIIASHMTSFGYWVKAGGQFLMRETVTRAIEASGATIASIEWIELPTHAVKIPGTDGYWLPNPAQHNLLCLGFGAVVAFDFHGETTEQYGLTVQNAESIARFGVIAEQMSGALEGIFEDPTAAEHATLLYKKKISAIPPRSTVPLSVGYVNSADVEMTGETDHAAAVAAMECLLAVARTKIAAAHRRNSVTASIPADPYADLWNVVSVAAPGVSATGKVRRVVHQLDAASGEATTKLTLAISACAGPAFEHQVTAPTIPDGTAAGVGNPVSAVDITWNGLYGQDGTLTITFPEVSSAERNSAEAQFTGAYETDINENPFEVTL